MGQNGSVFTGRTLDEAVRKGLEALGLTRAEVMIRTIEEGSGGFLGLGARPYKVQVTPRPGGAPREPESRGFRGRSGGERRGRAGRSGRDRDRRGGKGSQERGRRGERQASAEKNGKASERKADRSPQKPEREAVTSDDSPRKPRRRGRRGGRGRRGARRGRSAEGQPMEEREQQQPQQDAVATEQQQAPEQVERSAAEEPQQSAAPAVAEHAEDETTSRERGSRRGRRSEGAATETAEVSALDAETLSTRAREATESLLNAMGFEAKVAAKAEGDRVDVTAEVPTDDDLLTGRKGEVRQAMQHLLNRMVNRGEGSRYHLQLEINDFWQQREDELVGIAKGLANEAVEKDDEVVTEYLNAQERRIIHVTLRDDSRVKTYALGTGLIKRVAIAPASFPGGEEEQG